MSRYKPQSSPHGLQPWPADPAPVYTGVGQCSNVLVPGFTINSPLAGKNLREYCIVCIEYVGGKFQVGELLRTFFSQELIVNFHLYTSLIRCSLLCSSLLGIILLAAFLTVVVVVSGGSRISLHSVNIGLKWPALSGSSEKLFLASRYDFWMF